MKIRAWGPLLALLALFGAGLTGTALQYSEPHNLAEPTKSETRIGPEAKPIAEGAADASIREGKEKRAWYEPFFEKPTDSLLVLFSGLLALYTFQLYRATRGLFTETAGLREAAAEQSRDMKDSIRVSQRAADAAMTSAEVSKAAIRAVITLNNYSGGRSLDPSGGVLGYHMRPNITNVGSTHALNATLITAIKVLPINGEHHFSRESGKAPIAAIGPGAHLSSSENIGLMLDDAMKIWRNEAMCLLWCRIDYTDVMGDRHHVEQCVRVTFRDDPSLTGEILRPEQFLSYSAFGPQNTAS